MRVATALFLSTGLFLFNFRALATVLDVALLARRCSVKLVTLIVLLHTIQDLVINELRRADKLDVSSVFDFGHSINVFVLIRHLLLLELLLNVLENIVGFIGGNGQRIVEVVVRLGRIKCVGK